MPNLVIFNGALGAAFVPSAPIFIAAREVPLDFVVTVTDPADVEWFMEFTAEDPTDAATLWRREIAEEDVGGGIVNMPKVVRRLRENGGAILAVGVHALTAQSIRTHGYCRVQSRVASGAASVQILAPLQDSTPAAPL